MKRFIFTIAAALMIAGCAPDGPVAPKEGRKSIGVQPVEIAVSKMGIKPAHSVIVNDWPSAFANSANNRPNARLSHDVQELKRSGSISVGKGLSSDRVAVAGPVIANGIAYTLDGDFALQATDLTAQKRLWRRPLAEEVGPQAGGIGLTVRGDRLYAVGADGAVIVTDLSGNGIWKKNLKAQLRSEPVIDGNRLFVSSVQNELFVLDVKDGQILWQYAGDPTQTGFFGIGTPAVADGHVIMPTANGRINAFDVATGVLLWTENLWRNKTHHPLLDMTHITASPVIDGQDVYLVGNAGKTGAWRVADGIRRLNADIGGRETPILSGNVLFMVTNKGSLLALNRANGDSWWETPLTTAEKGTAVWFGPMIVNDSIVVVSDKGDIVFYDRQTGQEQRRLKEEALVRAPVVVGDMMILMSASGDLILYR